MFVTQFPDLFPTVYHASLQQAMFLANNPLLEELLQPRPDNLTRRLLALSNAKEQVRLAFNSVFGRWPDAEELQHAAEYLAARQAKPEAGVKQLLWALLTSAEFQVNH